MTTEEEDQGWADNTGAISAEMETSFHCVPLAHSTGFICNLQLWQLLHLDPACCTPHPCPGQDTAVVFGFGGAFFLQLGVYLCEGRAQRGPLVQCRALSSLRIKPLASMYWHFPPWSWTFCSTVELWERLRK